MPTPAARPACPLCGGTRRTLVRTFATDALVCADCGFSQPARADDVAGWVARWQAAVARRARAMPDSPTGPTGGGPPP